MRGAGVYRAAFLVLMHDPCSSKCTSACPRLCMNRGPAQSPVAAVPLQAGAQDVFPAPHFSPAKMGSRCWHRRPGLGGGCIPALRWLMHRKGKIPKAGDGDGSELCSPGVPAQMEGEAAGMQELSESFTQAELQQEPLFQLRIPDPMPRFLLGSVINLSEQAGCWFEFMQLKSSWMLLNIAVCWTFFLFFFLPLKLGTQP